jgi:Cys-tRNA(Pro)/Cys-tRNA(Cys) deacylase
LSSVLVEAGQIAVIPGALPLVAGPSRSSEGFVIFNIVPPRQRLAQSVRPVFKAPSTGDGMARTTPATIALAKAGLAFSLHAYDYDPGADRVGLQAAAALGEDPRRVLKTLMTLVDDKPVVVILASDKEVSMKALAAAVGAKSAQMMAPAEAERRTGYKVGGISPFGQKRRAPTVLDAAALQEAQVYVNGGQRGLQIRLAPADLLTVLGARTAAIAV